MHPAIVEVIKPGTHTTIQSAPGRIGYWDIGVPPSGPMDSLSFRLGNRLLGNDAKAPGLEMTVTGSTLKFHFPTRIVLTGAVMRAQINGVDVSYWETIEIDCWGYSQDGNYRGCGCSYLFAHRRWI